MYAGRGRFATGETRNNRVTRRQTMRNKLTTGGLEKKNTFIPKRRTGYSWDHGLLMNQKPTAKEKKNDF